MRGWQLFWAIVIGIILLPPTLQSVGLWTGNPGLKDSYQAGENAFVEELKDRFSSLTKTSAGNSRGTSVKFFIEVIRPPAGYPNRRGNFGGRVIVYSCDGAGNVDRLPGGRWSDPVADLEIDPGGEYWDPSGLGIGDGYLTFVVIDRGALTIPRGAIWSRPYLWSGGKTAGGTVTLQASVP